MSPEAYFAYSLALLLFSAHITFLIDILSLVKLINQYTLYNFFSLDLQTLEFTHFSDTG